MAHLEHCRDGLRKTSSSVSASGFGIPQEVFVSLIMLLWKDSSWFYNAVQRLRFCLGRTSPGSGIEPQRVHVVKVSNPVCDM